MLPATAKRVEDNTAEAVNRKIRFKIEERIDHYASHPEEIPARLQQLDREWDTERCLETVSASLTLAGLMLGAARNRKWYVLSAAVQGFFLQHALQGWCPPLPVFRRFGVRSANEIAQERAALKVLLDRLGHSPLGVSSETDKASARALL